ncbi:hypothetical protein [Halocatena halophila]|uniref:hypothetical protein n=1 Tax=Halocatena halophila TaxID=2814576 RepID=UPI002ED065AE
MERRSVLVGSFIAIGIVAVLWLGTTGIDALSGVSEPEVTTERINETHAAIAWTNDQPTTGEVQIVTSTECDSDAGDVLKRFPVTTNQRTHVAVVPVYAVPQTDSADLKWFSTQLKVDGGGDAIFKEVHRESLSEACS